ncbi:MAG: EF2563 family selenium-dependent molybdenum hydroxylase system protein [Spirochaetales bacterium]|nr:EF2563 family selenium-dependent molybdenum hydroxylase system protein [Spirochaetales bacterium]
MNIFKEALDLQTKNIPFAMATIVSAEGSTPRTNAKMIILGDGEIRGTIGGGLAEAFVIKEAISCIERNKAKVVKYTLDHGTGTSSIAMDCGGNLEIFIEVIGSKPALLIIGGGHVGLKIAEQAVNLNFSVSVADNRAEFSSQERFPMALNCYTGTTIDESIEKAAISRNTYIVICTGSVDDKALRKVIDSEAAYIGMLGSSRKINRIMENMREDGFTEEVLDAVYAPIGVDLQAETPEEIAFSILSEIKRIQAGTSGKSLKKRDDNLVVVRGGGDIASGTIARLHRSGYKVVVLEIEAPTVIRSTVSFAQAIYDGEIMVEDIPAVKSEGLKDIRKVLAEAKIPVVIDPEAKLVTALKPVALIDGILAKKNIGTRRDMAPAVIALGPGFEAGLDVDAVIETMRGHNLGRVILQGKPMKNTGVPGNIGGYDKERVIRAPSKGKMKPKKTIGDLVQKGDLLAVIGTIEIRAEIDGVIRGMLKEGLPVTEGFKIGDIDPRGVVENCFSISDKARAVGGGSLEALLYLTTPRKR